VARSPLPDSEFVGQTFVRHIEKGLRPLVKSNISALILDSRVVKVSEALQGVSVPAMLGLVEVENAKSQALLNIDTDLVYHLIDLMLGGDPSATSKPITRTLTAIDMALCSFSQKAILAAFVEALEASFGRRFGRKMNLIDQRQDITQIRFAPENVDVLVYNVALDIGDAARSGKLSLFLPLALLDAIHAAMRNERAPVEIETTSDMWKTHMRRAASTAPVVVNAVLHRQRLTIADLEALKPGDVLELPQTAIDEVQLLIQQSRDKFVHIASGKLGAYQGSKVIRMAGSVDTRVQEHIRRSL
jgi:flagellar motor switch protein FliM